MTHKQRMLAALQGRNTDRIPWAPRLDLWYKANKRAGTLPKDFQNDSLMGITDKLDFGFHAVVPDFKDLRSLEDEVDRALGIYNLHAMPYQTVLENIKRKVHVECDRTFVEYETPVGSVRTVVLYDNTMRKAGITVTHIEEHAIKNVSDYKVLGYIFENARVEKNYANYENWAGMIDQRGLAVGFVSLAGSPMHLIQRELMPMDLFFYHMTDHPDEMAYLVENIEKYWERICEVVSKSPVEVVFWGANYDATVTYPPFFEQHIKPWLRKCADKLHTHGKYLLTHTDGENTGLLELYLDAKIDIADSICPAPMTKLTFKQTKDVFNGKISIMGGIPSIALLENSMSEAEFEMFLDKFFKDIEAGEHLILGISDTAPPAAKFERLLKIARRVEAFGPVSPAN